MNCGRRERRGVRCRGDADLQTARRVLSPTPIDRPVMFPFALTMLGIAIIFLGVTYQRNRAVLYASAQDWVPEGVRELIPPRARG